MPGGSSSVSRRAESPAGRIGTSAFFVFCWRRNSGGFGRVGGSGWKEATMLIGRITRLVHLSQQTHVPGTRLVAGRNDKGYGILEAEDGQEVYFSHEIVAGLHGFDELRRGQTLEYTLDEPYLRAATASLVAAVPTHVLGPAA
jgi:cold shock CspA family protein